MPCVRPGVVVGALVLGVVGEGAGVEVGTAAGGVGRGVEATSVEVGRAAGELLTARALCCVGAGLVRWLAGCAAGRGVGSRTGRVNPGIGTPLSRLTSTTTVAATNTAAAVRMPTRSARVRAPVASANTVRFVLCRPNQGPLAARTYS